MEIRSIGIIGGTNGIGASFVRYFEDRLRHTPLQSPLKGGKVLVSGRRTDISNKNIVQKCDLVIFAVPIMVTQSVIAECVPESRPDQIWADFTSIKEKPVQAMLQSKAQVCGLHPMFAPCADVRGKKLIVTPARIDDEALAALESLFSDLDLIHSTPEEHDQLMGVVQGLSHFSDFVLGATLRDLGIDFQTVLDFSSPPYRLKLDVLGRMFAQNPALYAQIATQNPATIETTRAFYQTFQRLEDFVEKKDAAALTREFTAVGDFLGEEFCTEAYARAEGILGQQLPSVQDSGQAGMTPQYSEKAEVAVFGYPDSHTDEASWLFLERQNAQSVRWCKTIFAAFDTVDKGEVEAAIVPYENSTRGSVFETLDCLFDFPTVQIAGAQEKTIEQHLLGLPGASLDHIAKVLSHPQAVWQSQKWLRQHLPHAALQHEVSTASAAQHVLASKNPGWAAIGSRLLAEKKGLSILAENLEEEENRTTFVIVRRKGGEEERSKGRKECRGVGRKGKTGEQDDETTRLREWEKTSLVFWFSADHSGNLAQVLNFFSEREINLTKIDSRRAGAEYGRYLFFVDAELRASECEAMLSELHRLVGGVRVLGHF